MREIGLEKRQAEIVAEYELARARAKKAYEVRRRAKALKWF